MKLNKRKIIVDVDDTVLNSSEAIIKMLNLKNNTKYTIKDLKDYGYKSIDREMNKKYIDDWYKSRPFWNIVDIDPDFDRFANKYKNDFEFVFVTSGTEDNIYIKEIFMTEYCRANKLDFQYYGCVQGKQYKKDILLDDVYLAVDDNPESLMSVNAPMKILITHGLEFRRIPANEENLYSVDNWNDVDTMIQFDYKLKKEGILIG